MLHTEEFLVAVWMKIWLWFHWTQLFLNIKWKVY